jgi:aerobic carbon-monoxide dehydrogenase medium subunit
MPKYNPTELLRPQTPAEAVSMLSLQGQMARIVAGNTTIYEFARQGVLADIQKLIDIEQLGLSYIRRDDDIQTLHIGSATTFGELSESALVNNAGYYALKEAALRITPPQIRNMGTVGGSLCSGIPFYDMPTAVMAFDARIKILSVRGERQVSVDDFFVDYFTTSVAQDELVLEVQLVAQKNSASSFVKMGRTSVDFAIVNAAASIDFDDSTGCVTNARVALGAVSNTVLRASATEKALLGSDLNTRIILEASEAAANFEPSPSIHASGKYKKQIIPVVVRDALLKAKERLDRRSKFA